MQLNDLKILFHDTLDSIYGQDEVASFFFLCTEKFYNISRLELALNRELSITKAEQNPIIDALALLQKEKPIQYILGETEFFGLPIKINEHTLIPRPETEELVQLILQTSAKEMSSVLDIGTGSGCIAIALANSNKFDSVFAMDVSQKAIEKAKENATLNKVNLNFVNASILESSNWETKFRDLKFDIIVSNPPYVRNLEKKEISKNVLENEPHLALFVEDNNPLIFYRAITEFATKKLNQNGQLFFEINEYLGPETKALVESFNFKNVEIIKDMFGKDRMLKANI